MRAIRAFLAAIFMLIAYGVYAQLTDYARERSRLVVRTTTPKRFQVLSGPSPFSVSVLRDNDTKREYVVVCTDSAIRVSYNRAYMEEPVSRINQCSVALMPESAR